MPTPSSARRFAVVLVAISMVTVACSADPGAAAGVTVQVVWNGGGDEPGDYAGFRVEVVPLVRTPGRDASDEPVWRADKEATPVTGVTDADGRVVIDVSPAFPYRARAFKKVPLTSDQCHWLGSTSMESGGSLVAVGVDEACA